MFNVWIYFSSLDDLLKAGINKASHLVVVNREAEQNMAGEETLADSETILAVQTVFRCVCMFGGGWGGWSGGWGGEWNVEGWGGGVWWACGVGLWSGGWGGGVGGGGGRFVCLVLVYV